MDCELTFINHSTDTPIPALFVDPLGGGSGLYVPLLRPGSRQVIPYPTTLGSKVMVSFSFDGILIFGGDFDLTGVSSCDFLVNVASGYPTISLSNVIRN